MTIVFALLTALATIAGGTLAIRARNRMHLVLGLSGGLLLGLVAFDLLPEVFSTTAHDIFGVPLPALGLVIGYLSLHIAERAFGSHEPSHAGHEHQHGITDMVGAVGLVVHVFLDGMAIGFSFRVSTSLGIAVTIAVLAHAFSDGLNTVALLIKHGDWQRKATLLLASDAAARVLGAAVGTYISVEDNLVNLYLALFAGFLIYLATTHILPEAHSEKPSRMTLVATFLGVALMFVIVAAGSHAH